MIATLDEGCLSSSSSQLRQLPTISFRFGTTEQKVWISIEIAIIDLIKPSKTNKPDKQISKYHSIGSFIASICLI